jgi:MATE family multidrug resistance protein
MTPMALLADPQPKPNNKSLNLAAYTKEFSYNLKLSYPVIIGMLGHTFVQFIDNVMVGQLGTAELAAISLGNSFIFIAMSVGIGFSTAITPLVAEGDSANRPEEVKSILSHGLLWCLFLGLALFLAVYLSRNLMFSMGQPEEVVVLAFPYLQWVAVSLFPLIVFQAFKQFTDGMSLTRYAMYATVLANVVNVVVNYVLIFGKWGFPAWGITGAAIGTLISRLVMLFALMILIRFHNKLSIYFKGLLKQAYSIAHMRKLFRLGFPSALQMLFEVAFFTSAIWVCGLLGKNEQAANQIALNISSMTFMVAMGLSVAATVRVGNQKGLGSYVDLRRIAQSVFLLTLLIDIIFAVVFIFAKDAFPWLYLESSSAVDVLEVATIASSLFLIAAFFQIFDGAQVVALGALRGLQDVIVPTWICFASYGLVGFTTMFYLGLYTHLEALGVWIGLLAGLVTSSLLLYLRFLYQTNKLIHNNGTTS